MVVVTVDPELCIGSGDCIRIAPAAFVLDEERGVSVVRPGASAVDRSLLEAAARGCPMQAILLRDGDEHPQVGGSDGRSTLDREG